METSNTILGMHTLGLARRRGGAAGGGGGGGGGAPSVNIIKYVQEQYKRRR